MPEDNTINLFELLKYGWTLLIGVCWWMWNRLVGKVDQLKEDLSDHTLSDVKNHKEFITHEYVKEDIKPWMAEIDDDLKTLISQTADVIKRDEYKKDIGNLYEDIGKLNGEIQGIKGMLKRGSDD